MKLKTFLLFILLAWPMLFSIYCQSWIRINQLGYIPASVKVAVLICKNSAHPAEFKIHDALTDKVLFKSNKLKDFGIYGNFKSSFRLDFSEFNREGSFYLSCDSVNSPVFRISNNVYDGTADFLLNYMRQQQCGYNPFLKDSCHTRDGYIIYQGIKDSSFIDVTGGWHDATDYLQYTATSANAVFQMLFAYRENPSAFADYFDASGNLGNNGIPDILDQARWGLSWLLKMNPDSGQMYNQVADDRDHVGFRLPNNDSANYGIGLERPVYFCTGKEQGLFRYKNRATGIASTAGKYASAFALASIVFKKTNPAYASLLEKKAFQAYNFGKANPGACQTAPCTAPYFYEEDNWVDDMELAAATLNQLKPSRNLLAEAIFYGKQEPVTPWMGSDTARHYQWYPFYNLGHFMIRQVQNSKNQGIVNKGHLNEADSLSEFLDFWRQGIEKVADKGKTDPFNIGIPFIWCSNNLVSAIASQCHLYARTSGDHTYDRMEAALRDWLFGCNPWGISMIVGLPSFGISPTDVHSSLSHLKGYKLSGGLVDGPVYTSIYNNLKGIYLANGDKFQLVQPRRIVYHDDYADYSTNEPTMDGTADLSYYLSSLQEENSHKHEGLTKLKGAIVRTDTLKKQISLVFTGNEFADGAETVLNTLRKHNIKAAFFLTGDFYRNAHFKQLVIKIESDGHYIAGHSDKHLLYCDWKNRDSLLISKQQFIMDLKSNYNVIPGKSPKIFLPPYEWYNDSISSWCNEFGIQLINFTPGTSSNQDWTYPALGKQYLSSDTIYNRILEFEKNSTHGLNGFILLTHFGTDTRRKDKFYNRLDGLITILEQKGYRFTRIDKALAE